MPKIAIIVTLAALAALGQVSAFPTRENDIASAAATGNWDEVHRLLNEFYEKKYGLTPIAASDLKNYKLQPGGGHFYGEAEYTFHSALNNNGQKSEQSGGHKVINNDGKITEYDFQPQRTRF